MVDIPEHSHPPMMAGPARDLTDPTERTRQDLTQRIDDLRELLETQIVAHADINGTKIDALSALVTELKNTTDTRISAEIRIGQEHDRAVEKQLTFLEAQRQEQKQDTAKAVEAALAAAKEAVSITAANTKEQIAALTTSFQTTMGALGEKLDDVKNVTTSIAERRVGGQEATLERRQSSAAIYAMVGVGGTILGIVLGLIGFFAARGGP